jgi:hypothetical protein
MDKESVIMINAVVSRFFVGDCCHDVAVSQCPDTKDFQLEFIRYMGGYKIDSHFPQVYQDYISKISSDKATNTVNNYRICNK